MDTFFLKLANFELQQEFEDSYAQNLRYDKKKSRSSLNLVSKLLIFFQNGLVLGCQKRGPQKVVLFIQKKHNTIQSVPPLKI